MIVSVREEVPSLARCLGLEIAGLPSGWPRQRRVINGTVFYRQMLRDAGAGNFYKLTGYRTLHKGTCYTLTLFIHWSNIGAFTPGTVSPFEERAVLRELELVLRTFHLPR